MNFDFALGLQVSIIGLERALHNYNLEPSETPFDLKSVPLATQPITEQKPVAATAGETAAPKSSEKVAASRQDIYAGMLWSSGPFNPSNAVATFVQSTRTQTFLKTI